MTNISPQNLQLVVIKTCNSSLSPTFTLFWPSSRQNNSTSLRFNCISCSVCRGSNQDHRHIKDVLQNLTLPTQLSKAGTPTAGPQCQAELQFSPSSLEKSSPPVGSSGFFCLQEVRQMIKANNVAHDIPIDTQISKA